MGRSFLIEATAFAPFDAKFVVFVARNLTQKSFPADTLDVGLIRSEIQLTVVEFQR